MDDNVDDNVDDNGDDTSVNDTSVNNRLRIDSFLLLDCMGGIVGRLCTRLRFMVDRIG